MVFNVALTNHGLGAVLYLPRRKQVPAEIPAAETWASWLLPGNSCIVKPFNGNNRKMDRTGGHYGNKPDSDLK